MKKHFSIFIQSKIILATILVTVLTPTSSAGSYEVNYDLSIPLVGGFKYDSESLQPSISRSDTLSAKWVLDGRILLGVAYRRDTIFGTQEATTRRNYAQFSGSHQSLGLISGLRIALVNSLSVDAKITVANGQFSFKDTDASQSADLSNIWSTCGEIQSLYFLSLPNSTQWYFGGGLSIYKIFIPAFSYQNIEYNKDFNGMTFYMLGLSTGLNF